MLYKTDWLIEQQIAWYFSRISALTKAGLLGRFSSVSMNKDEEVDADDLVSETDRTRQKIKRDLEKFRRRLQGRIQLPQPLKKDRPLHLTFLANLSSLPMKTTGYVRGFFHHGKFAGSLQVKTLLAHSLSHAIQRRYFNVGKSTSATLERRDADLHVGIACLKKKRKIFYGRGKQIHIEICRIFWNFFLADSMNNEEYSGHDVYRDVHVSFGGVLHGCVRWR